mgnify:CR=1 FL=1
MPHSKLREFAITVKDERLQGFGALAKKHGMVICIPYCERPEEVGTHDGKQEEGAGVFYNSAAVFGPTGELIVNCEPMCLSLCRCYLMWCFQTYRPENTPVVILRARDVHSRRRVAASRSLRSSV